MERHRQLHLWITEHDYSLLREMAQERQETLSAVIRRLIKMHRVGAQLDPQGTGLQTDADLWPI
jgi:hypothetical protein